MSLNQAVSEANRVLPELFASSHAQLLRGAAQFSPCEHTVDGARRALHFVDRVRDHVPTAAPTLTQVRADLVRELAAANADPSPFHPHAAKHHAEEVAARTSRAIRVALDTRHFPAPVGHARRVVDGVERTFSGHDGFDDSNHDAGYLADWLKAMHDGDKARDDGDRANAWLRMLAELRDVTAKAA